MASCGSSAQLTSDLLTSLREEFYADEKNRVAQNACTRTDPLEVCTSRNNLEEISHVFNRRIEQEGKPMTNQKSSGRCWIFAMLNIARIPFVKKYHLDEFEFSQSHLFFYDKIERCNYFLNSMIDVYNRGEKVDGRLSQFLLDDPISDGGQWDMLVNLVTKYGMMPKKNFPESYSSEASQRLNVILRSKLREYAKDIREMMSKNPDAEQIKSLISKQMVQLHKIVAICLGIPKNEFVWEYYDKNKVYHKVGPITPQNFYEEYVKPVFDIENKVCLVNDQREAHSFGKLYTVDLLGNCVGGKMTIYNNQPIDLLMQVAADSITAGEPVWFGCEVAKRFAAKQGIEDLSIHDYKSVFGVDVANVLKKSERMLYGESKMTHAMVFTAVSVDDNGVPTKWRVENSWGEDRGEKGYLVMSADWFKEFVFEVVVDKQYVSADVLKAFEQTPIVLPAWDPMGSLA
ncbi:unnamed protein product [Orchesella dallaii]|uniref:Bleomycin hydrolase n=1 Tax=Orchesella dallaii TaxID=48710 RepID=A0ABP1Q731_9HEXA